MHATYCFHEHKVGITSIQSKLIDPPDLASRNVNVSGAGLALPKAGLEERRV